jgi:biopolymer transport protein ExbB
MTGFKAAVLKEATQESRRLASGTLVLNVAVTGSPFMGLLGTVWGVMNTFARLAESSEANLAAIAPGVASALACTLAGLLVAIPALFAYSYLTSRIRDLNADVKMFIDEFIFKLEKGKTGRNMDANADMQMFIRDFISKLDKVRSDVPGRQPI